MSKKIHRVPQDLKQQILERVKKGEKSIKEIATEHGISEQSIYTWLKTTAIGFSGKDELKLRKENHELKQIIGELTIQLSQAQKKGSLKRM
jgi:transposase-like protein